MIRLRTALLPFLASGAVLLAACGGNDVADESADMSADAMVMPDAAPMTTVMASLDGAAERPDPVTTTATGDASFMLYADSVVYTVNANNLMSVTAVHIHRGGPEEAGPPVATLFTSETGTDFAGGPLVTGTMSRETTLPEGTTFDDVRELLRSGGAYVNVHTTAHPKGEVRGQVNGSVM